MAAERIDEYQIGIEEVEYLRHGDKPYLARVFRPRGQGPFPAVVEAHGGAWCMGARANNDTINEAVARGGVVVAALDFRDPPDATYPGSVADINYGVRWLKSEAERFATLPGMVGSMGTSSGGHLVVLAALKPDDPRYAAIPSPAGAAVDARVPYVVTLWPVICPLGRYRYAETNLAQAEDKESWRTMMANQDKYWISQDAMAEGSPNLAVERGDEIETPNILYVQNVADHIHPRDQLDSFIAGYREAGGNVQQEDFEGEKYDQIRSEPSSDSAREAVRKIIRFIHAQAG